MYKAQQAQEQPGAAADTQPEESGAQSDDDENIVEGNFTNVDEGSDNDENGDKKTSA